MPGRGSGGCLRSALPSARPSGAAGWRRSRLGRLGRQHAGVGRELHAEDGLPEGIAGIEAREERKARPSASSTKPPCALCPAIARRCPSGLNASDSIAAIGAVWCSSRSAVASGVEERDGAVEIADGERVAVWMERGRGDAVTVTSHHADGGRIAAEDVQQAVARAGVSSRATPCRASSSDRSRVGSFSACAPSRCASAAVACLRRGRRSPARARLPRPPRRGARPRRRTRSVHDAGPARSRLGSRRGSAARPRRAPARADRHSSADASRAPRYRSARSRPPSRQRLAAWASWRCR